MVFNCACDARACVVLHIDESLMMLYTSEMRDVMIDLVKSIPPTTENWLRKLYEYNMNNNTSIEGIA